LPQEGDELSFRGAFWKTWYSILAWYSEKQGASYHCMNWGYEDGEITAPQPVGPERFSLQLYHRLVHGTELKGKRVLEVSCGRGGGLAHLFRQLQPKEAVGIDFTPRNVEVCNKAFGHLSPSLRYEVGRAEELKLPDESVDVVLTVEASHCYADVEKFVQEAKRVLKPGGLLLWTDFRPLPDVPGVKELAKRHFNVVEDKDITPNVLKAVEMDAPRRVQFIDQHSAAPLRGIFRQFAAADTSSVMYKRFATGKDQYFMLRLQKAAASA
jgi:ubiquinone/menaquinone biosynthesis C-methylase UbiE